MEEIFQGDCRTSYATLGCPKFFSRKIAWILYTC